ncbi:MAG: DUF5069 domain-containing protein [Nitrospira sp.]|nr:MAG: DUF5069 domain-containing protein [Nitrospira sp.]
MDLRKDVPRSMRVKMAGFVHLARMIDKCRAVLAKTEGEYIYPCPMDDRLMEFSGITSDQFTAAVKANPSDDTVAKWLTLTAKAHSPAELESWNRMMLSPTRGVRDRALREHRRSSAFIPLSFLRRIRRHEHEDFETLACVILHAVFFPGRSHRPLPWSQYLFL